MTGKDTDVQGKPHVELLDIDFKFINALAKKDDSSVEDADSKKRAKFAATCSSERSEIS